MVVVEMQAIMIFDPQFAWPLYDALLVSEHFMGTAIYHNMSLRLLVSLTPKMSNVLHTAAELMLSDVRYVERRTISVLKVYLSLRQLSK